MYAVIETGGKQYRVEVGTELEVELLEAEAGQSITLDRVLLVADGDQASVGRPLVENAAVAADVVRRTRSDKVISFKYRPKARRRVTKGHRQDMTVLRISDITLDGRSAAADLRAAEAAVLGERQRIEEAAKRQAAADAELAASLAAKTKGAPSTSGPSEKRASRARVVAPKPGPAAPKPGPAAPKEKAATKNDAVPKATADSNGAAAEDQPDAPRRARRTKKDG